MAFFLATCPTLVALYSDMNAANPRVDAWRALAAEFRNIYVPGMHNTEYLLARSYWWRSIRQTLATVGISAAEATHELSQLQEAMHVHHAQVAPPWGALWRTPEVRHYPDPPMMVPEDTESDEDEDDHM